MVGDDMLSVPGEFAEGSRFAGYRLDEQVGRGSMAVVYRAYDTRLDRRVAVKIMAPELSQDENFRQRFIRESRAVAAVDHPNIIPVFEAGEASGVLFIAMRFVEGGDLRTLLNGQVALPVAQACDIVAQVASALDAAHERGLVHRDVRPSNILREEVSGSGPSDHVYLSDFGLYESRLAVSDLTEPGRLPGTGDYLAPEEIVGQPTDGRTDEYALACCAFEMLSGTPPFRRDQAAATMYAQLSSAPPSLSGPRPGLPAAVDQVMARALAKAPADRYGTCLEFNAALWRACGLDARPGAVTSLRDPDVSEFSASQGPPAAWESAGQAARPDDTAAFARPPARAASGARAEPAPRRADRRESRRRSPAAEYDDAISRAVKAAVKPGLLSFNPPAEMVQGRKERVEVGIARSPELREALATGLRGRGDLQFEGIRTSPYMGVELSGSGFEVTSFSPLEQLVAPVARWEFDVRPFRAGRQKLALCVSMRIDSPKTTGGRIAVPVLEREIRIRVDLGFSTSRFLAKNWQWLIATILALGGALAAWAALLH
jgi:tRNA A-37 threonylcarbamoyl transferase component Bud32